MANKKRGIGPIDFRRRLEEIERTQDIPLTENVKVPTRTAPGSPYILTGDIDDMIAGLNNNLQTIQTKLKEFQNLKRFLKKSDQNFGKFVDAFYEMSNVPILDIKAVYSEKADINAIIFNVYQPSKLRVLDMKEVKRLAGNYLHNFKSFGVNSNGLIGYNLQY